MAHWRPFGRWRGNLTSESAVQRAIEQCGQARWAEVFGRRFAARRTWRTWVVHLGVDERPSGPWLYVDARDGVVRRVEHSPPANRRRRVAAGGLLGLVVVLMAAAFFVRVCNDQVLSSGKVVPACRHVQASDPIIIAMGIVVVAALGVFYSEISGFGISLKRQVDEVGQAAHTGLQLAEQTRKDLNETAQDVEDYRRAGGRPAPEPSARGGGEPEPAPSARVRDLASQYNTLRGTMPSSDLRTQRMANIVAEFRTLLSDVPEFDVPEHLKSTDRGLRLAAYAYLMEHPAPQYRPDLVEAAASVEDKPFGQYTALEALKFQVESTRERLRSADMAALSSLAQRLGPAEDRTRLITEIVARDAVKA